MGMRGILLLLDFVPNQQRTFEAFLLRLTRALAADGWQPVFVFSGEPSDAFAGQLHADGAEYRLAKFPLTQQGADTLVKSLSGLPLVAMTNAFVSCFSPYLLQLKKRLGITYWIVYDHSSGLASDKSWFKSLLARLRGWYYGRHINRVLAVSEFVAKRNVEQSFLPRSRVRVLPNGVDLDRFSPAPGLESCPTDEQRVVFIGQLIREKGVLTLLRALLELRSYSLASAPKVLVAGRGPLEAELRSYIADNGMGNVELLGQVLDVPALYRQATVVVVPSEWAEAFGLVVAEAMACGACVLAADVGGIPDVLGRDEDGGRLFRSGDVADLASKLAALLADPATRQKYRNQARARAEKFFALDHMVQGFVRELRDVCRAGGTMKS